MRGVSLLTSCPVPPTLMAWHPAGGLVLVGGGQGELMGLDVGLAPLGLTLVGEDPCPASATLRLAQHLHCPGGLEQLQWAWGTGPEAGLEGADTVLLVYHGGPLASLGFRLGCLSGGQLGPGELIQQRLRCGQVDQALGILGAMEWSIMGMECYRALTSITDHLLRLDLNQAREAQLEAALGLFYAPPRPLSDNVVLEYREPISKYARRFFHHLLRHQRFEKAFLLAVDIGARDLFMDLHYVAGDRGEVVLAEVARQKANEIDAEDALTTTFGNHDEPHSQLGGSNGLSVSTPGDSRVDSRVDRRVHRQVDRQVDRQTDQAPARPSSQESLASRSAVGSNKRLTMEETNNWKLSTNVTQPWRQTDIGLVDSNDKVLDNAGQLKVIHFGLV
ncbi:hypothetical protein UPYG_G00132410 [Umbra pygmaea]|uniref:WD repeat-containing and planar cell polarity effector protein fritz homolog n=1 Tax=Umbra pygmaea TaxID=75934 RepID=A0ABD0WTE2_UMBPY